jgi:formate dehydrogenase subunit delta
MSGVAHLVKMANDIGDFFASEPDREAAISGIAGHIRRYWEPRMRRQIYAHLAAGGEGLGELARDAVARLAQNDQAAAAAPSAW